MIRLPYRVLTWWLCNRFGHSGWRYQDLGMSYVFNEPTFYCPRCRRLFWPTPD